MDEGTLAAAVSDYDAYELLMLERKELISVMNQMPENLLWFLKQKRWRGSESEDLIHLLNHHRRRHMPPCMEAAIYKELVDRKPTMEQEDIERLTEHLNERIMTYTTDIYYRDEYNEFDLGMKRKIVGEDLNGIVKITDRFTESANTILFVFYAFAQCPDLELIDSLLHSTYDAYNWHDNETGLNQRNHEFIVFLARNSKYCYEKITGTLRSICEKNEKMWRNSTFFDDHSGSYKALELIDYKVRDEVEGIPEQLIFPLNWEEQKSVIDIVTQKHKA